MNFKHIKTLIVFSFVAAIAQPMQAVTYKDQARKIGRCTWHLAKIASGAVIFLKTLEDCRELLRCAQSELREYPHMIQKRQEHEADLCMDLICFPAALATIKSGYDGLKSEWAKN